MSTRLDLKRVIAVGTASGIFYWLAMPGVGWWPLAFVAFLPIYLWESTRTVDSLLSGFVAGFVATLGVCAWLPGAMHRMMSLPFALGGIALGFLGAWHGARFSLVSWLNHRARVKGVPGWLRLPLSLVAAELLLPVPFPFSLAATVHGLPLLIQIADLAGRLGIVLVLGSATAALGDGVRAVTIPNPRGSWKSVCFGFGPLIASVAYGSVRAPKVARDIARSPKLSVGLVQVNLAPQEKRSDPMRSLSEHLRLTEEMLRGPAPDLIIWSETAVAAPLDERLLASGLVRRFGRRFASPLLVGIVAKRELNADQAVLTNSAVLSTGDGYICPACRYDKQSLVPVAEGPLSRSSRFSRGEHAGALPFDSTHRIGILICFEAIFPQRVRELVVRERPQLLVNLTNDGWFADSEEPRLHFGLAKLRAVEHRLFLVRVATTGISAIVDPLGVTITSITQGARDAKIGSVAWLDANTLYDRLGDAPWWLLTLYIVVAGSSKLRSFSSAACRKWRRSTAAPEAQK